MNRPILFSIISLICYAIANVVVERKLSAYSPLVLTFWFCFLMSAIVAPAALRGVNFQQPISFWAWTALLAILFVIADWCYFAAYHEGGSLLQVSTIIALFPVAASIINVAAGGGMPTTNQAIGYILALAGVYLVAKK